MERRSLLKSLLLSPLAFLRPKQPGGEAGTRLTGIRQYVELNNIQLPHEVPYGADLRTGDGECLPEVRWDSLSEEEQRVLTFASTAFDGNAGAVFPITRQNARSRAQDRLYRLGLLTFTSKVPDHKFDLCGWYTISHYGRGIVPANVG
jgi:hypothetical protein